MTGKRWYFIHGTLRTTVAEASSRLPLLTVKEIAGALAYHYRAPIELMSGTPADARLRVRGVVGNPTLVHHGLTRGAHFHVLGRDNTPYADLYFTKGTLAHDVAQLIASKLNVVVLVKRNILDGRGGSIHMSTLSGRTRRNPARRPVAGEVWPRIGGGSCRVVSSDGLRITYVDLDTGNRHTEMLTEFLATHRTPRARVNPGRLYPRRVFRAERSGRMKKAHHHLGQTIQREMRRTPAEHAAEDARRSLRGNPKGRNWITEMAEYHRSMGREEFVEKMLEVMPAVGTLRTELRIAAGKAWDREHAAEGRKMAAERRAALTAFNKEFPKPRGRNGGRAHRAGRGPRKARARLNPRSDREAALEMFGTWQDRHDARGRWKKLKAPNRVPKHMAGLGELVEVVYESNKYDGKKKLYKHRTKRPRPVLATGDGRHVFIVGGNMKATADGLVN